MQDKEQIEIYYRNQVMAAIKAYEKYCGDYGGIVASVFYHENEGFFVDVTLSGATDFLKAFYSGGMGELKHVEGNNADAIEGMTGFMLETIMMKASNDPDLKEKMINILNGMPTGNEAPNSYLLEPAAPLQVIEYKNLVAWFDKCIDFYMEAPRHEEFDNFAFYLHPYLIPIWMNGEESFSESEKIAYKNLGINEREIKSRYQGFPIRMDIVDDPSAVRPYIVFTWPGGLDGRDEGFEKIISH